MRHKEIRAIMAAAEARKAARRAKREQAKPVPQLPVALAVKIGVGRSWAEATQAQR